MRSLEGVMALESGDVESLKRYSLFFDRLHVGGLFNLDATSQADADFLVERGFVLQLDDRFLGTFPLKELRIHPQTHALAAWMGDGGDEAREKALDPIDGIIRNCTLGMKREMTGVDVVPICRHQIPAKYVKDSDPLQMVIEVALGEFPSPDGMSAWDDILDFRTEVREKEWPFRRFLNTLATKKQTEAEIRDDIEYTLNEYIEGMKRRRMKIIRSSVAAIVVPAVDFVFNASGNHAAAILSVGLAINQLGIDLSQGEMSAPGRECAYVFEAKQEFGRGKAIPEQTS